MTERELGRLEAHYEALAKRVDGLESKLDEALAILQSARGGWRVFVAIGAATGALLSLIATFIGSMFGPRA